MHEEEVCDVMNFKGQYQSNFLDHTCDLAFIYQGFTTNIYIYIYIDREREREREWDYTWHARMRIAIGTWV